MGHSVSFGKDDKVRAWETESVPKKASHIPLERCTPRNAGNAHDPRPDLTFRFQTAPEGGTGSPTAPSRGACRSRRDNEGAFCTNFSPRNPCHIFVGSFFWFPRIKERLVTVRRQCCPLMTIRECSTAAVGFFVAFRSQTSRRGVGAGV